MSGERPPAGAPSGADPPPGADPARDPEALAARRVRRLWLFGASFVMVAILVAIAIAVSGDEGSGSTTGKPEGIAETTELYRGIPQRGSELGNPAAKVTLTEFADLQCPFCAEYGRDVFPEVVRRFVRTGRVKVAFRSLTFIGEDSEEAARMAHAAGQQNKLFQFVDLVYRNQGVEKTGWVDDDYLRRIGSAVGLDVDRAMDARAGAPVTAELERARSEGKAAKVESTPWFVVTRPGSEPARIKGDFSDAGAFSEALEQAIASR